MPALDLCFALYFIGVLHKFKFGKFFFLLPNTLLLLWPISPSIIDIFKLKYK